MIGNLQRRKHFRGLLSDYVERSLARDSKMKQGLVKPMTQDDHDLLSSLIVLDPPQATQSKRRDAGVNLLTYPHYWLLTDVELVEEWRVNHSTINRWRKRARKLLLDDDGRISPDRRAKMKELIESRMRVLRERDENDNRRTRQLSGPEPQIDSLRKIWSHEAYDFTTWLEKNIGVLKKATGLSLSNVKREQAAGDFMVDLVAEDESGNPVIIENQLEQSDHNHLGKVLTYLAWKGAKAAIWIVADATPEHRCAIWWLNESAPASFYLLKLAVPIGDSSSEPSLTTLVDPSGEGWKAGEKKGSCQLSLKL